MKEGRREGWVEEERGENEREEIEGKLEIREITERERERENKQGVQRARKLRDIATHRCVDLKIHKQLKSVLKKISR